MSKVHRAPISKELSKPKVFKKPGHKRLHTGTTYSIEYLESIYGKSTDMNSMNTAIHRNHNVASPQLTQPENLKAHQIRRRRSLASLPTKDFHSLSPESGPEQKLKQYSIRFDEIIKTNLPDSQDLREIKEFYDSYIRKLKLV